MNAITKPRATATGASITIPTRNLNEAMKLLRRVTFPATAITAMGSVRVQGARDNILLAGSNLDTRIDLLLEAEGSQETEPFLLPQAEKLVQTARRARRDTINLLASHQQGTDSLPRMKIALADSKDTAQADIEIALTPPASADDFPAPRKFHHEPLYSTHLTEELLTAFATIRPAISREATRYYLNGIFLEQARDVLAEEDWTVIATATDGHRLATIVTPLPGASGRLPLNDQRSGMRGIILPHPLIDLLLSLRQKPAPDEEQHPPILFSLHAPVQGNEAGGDLAKALSGNVNPVARLTLTRPRCTITITAQLIDGTYPDWRRVVPADSPAQASFETAALLRALDTLTAMDGRGRERLDDVSMRMTLADGQALLSRQWKVPFNTEMNLFVPYEGDPCQALGQPTLDVGFSAAYLREAVRSFRGCERVVFAWTTNLTSPVTIASGEKPDYRHIVMPRRY
jgi:DNA polymerase III subunit beta